MTSLPSVAVRGLGAACCALVSCLVLALPARAAEAPTPISTLPVEQLVELDEVRVRGKLVANTVITAENRLFMLYNRLNKDNRYDVHCHNLRRSLDSLIMLRVCLPEYLASLMAPAIVPSGFGNPGFGAMNSCGGMGSGFDMNGNMNAFSHCTLFGGSRYIGYAPPYVGNPSRASTTLVPAVAVPDERRTEFSQNMVRILNSDVQLRELATELVGMYREVDRIQARFQVLQQERRAAQKARLAAARERARARGHELRPPHPRAL
jgi:hypothetical protein